MQIRFGKRRRIRFTDKTHPAAGILSVVMGTVAWIVLIILVMISGAAGGKSGLVLGVAGLLDLVFSAVGFWLAMRCYKKEDIYIKRTPGIGAGNPLCYRSGLRFRIVSETETCLYKD